MLPLLRSSSSSFSVPGPEDRALVISELDDGSESDLREIRDWGVYSVNGGEDSGGSY